jgi:uroporphyrinogen-III synthase
MRVLITRVQAQTAEFADELRRIGADPIFLPTIDIQPVEDPGCLDSALSQLEHYDWMILTSANSADVVLERLAALKVSSPPSNLRIAAIGPKTAEKLRTGGIQPDFVPQQHIAEAILPGLGALKGLWVLLPLADIAHDTLPDAIQKADGFAHVITAYHTLPAEPDPAGMDAIRAGIDVITFTSGSTARNFVTILKRAGLDPFHLPGHPKIACIGPKTAKTTEELGFSVDIVASTYTVEGLVQAIASNYKELDSHETP